MKMAAHYIGTSLLFIVLAGTVAGSAQAQSAHVVAEALTRGLDAEQRQDGPAMLEQAQVLMRAGAHPDGGDDLARAWMREANRLTVTMSLLSSRPICSAGRVRLTTKILPR